MKYIFFKSLYLLAGCLLTGCADPPDYPNLPLKDNSGNYQAVIEIPAGTNIKIEYHKKRDEFLPDQRAGKDRLIKFLPYPGNYGFIPSTYSDPKKGGDGDALDVLVIGKTRKTGTVMAIKPIGLLKLLDEGESDYKIIAIPTEEDDQVLQVDNLNSLIRNYPNAKEIIELWFSGYDQDDVTDIEGWGDEKAAISEIKKWAKSYKLN